MTEDKVLGCAVVADDDLVKRDSITSDTVSDPNNITTLSLYHDTLFLRREVDTLESGWVDYNYVYIEKDRTSKFYSWLTSFQFHEFNIRSLESYGITGVTSSADFNENTQSGLPKNWIPLYQLNGEYYIYKPSDFGNAGRRILTDSLFIKWYMDGPMPFKIISQQQNADTHKFDLEVYDDTVEKLRIHLIDKKRQIYWFENPDEEKPSRKRLYIPAERAYEYELIVNTGNYKAREVMFDGMVMRKAPVNAPKQ